MFISPQTVVICLPTSWREAALSEYILFLVDWHVIVSSSIKLRCRLKYKLIILEELFRKITHNLHCQCIQESTRGCRKLLTFLYQLILYECCIMGERPVSKIGYQKLDSENTHLLMNNCKDNCKSYSLFLRYAQAVKRVTMLVMY